MSTALEPYPHEGSSLHGEARVMSHNEETYGAGPTTFNEDVDDVTGFTETGTSLMRASESPGTKRVMAMMDLKKLGVVEESAVQFPVKPLQRPSSAGDAASATPQYQMAAVNLRSAQVKRPSDAAKRRLTTIQTVDTVSPETQGLSQSEMPATSTESLCTNEIPASSPAQFSSVKATTKEPEHAATRGKHTAADSKSEKRSLQDGHLDEQTQLGLLPSDVNVRPGMQELTDAKRSRVTGFNFAPANNAQDNLLNQANIYSADSTRSVQLSERSTQLEMALHIEDANETSRQPPDTVLPSIEIEHIDGDETLVELPSKHVARHGSATSSLEAHTQIRVSASASGRSKPVLGARIVKRPIPKVGAQRSFPQHHHRSPATASLPSEDDLYFLLMYRNRQAKKGELELKENYKKLLVQLRKLDEQSSSYRQQLLAANAQTERQDSVIENFKSRFTKFKAYAQDLANDHAQMGAAMKKIGSTTDELVRDKVEVNRSLDSLRKTSNSANELLACMQPNISALAREAGPLRQALHTASEKLRITDSYLQHERLRNNRLETQILDGQQRQERLSFSSIQEYRNAATYLDDLCQTTLHLGKAVLKGQQQKDTPGVLKCLDMLQALTEKQGTGITTLTDTKKAIIAISEKLLSYHTTADEAAKTAASHGDQLSKDVLSQLATSLASIGPSIGTEVNFATMRERIAGLQRTLTLNNQTINLAFDGKTASEQREKEQSERVDKLIEQLAVANKQLRPNIETTPPPNLGLDAEMLHHRYLQANSNYTKAQSSLTKLQGEYDDLRGDAAAMMQENVTLKEQLKQMEDVSLEAAMVPVSMESLATRDAQLVKLQAQSSTISELEKDLASKEAELKALRLKAAQFDAKDSQNLVYQTDIHDYKKTIQTLEQQLAAINQDGAELAQLQKDNNALKAEAENVREYAQSLENEVRESRRSVQEVETLRKEVATLTVQSEDHDQLKKDLSAQKDTHAKQIAHLDDLQNKFDTAQALVSQVPTWQGKVQELSQRCEDLSQQLGEATKAIDKCETLASDLEQKDKEITILKMKLQKAEDAADQLSTVLPASPEQFGKLMVYEQKLRNLQNPETSLIDIEESITQQAMSELREATGQEEQANAIENTTKTLRGTACFATTSPDMSQRKKADRNSSGRRYADLRPSHAHGIENKNDHQPLQKTTGDIGGTEKIPDSQPHNDMQDTTATYSPLSDMESPSSAIRLASIAHGHRQNAPDNRPPSSSYGGDAMLLEDFEAAEGMIKHRHLESPVRNIEMSLSQRQSHKHPGYGHASSRTIVTKCATVSSHRRPRSGLSSQIIQETQSQEQSPSSPIMVPSSPAGLAKHLPNSAIKRPRLDPIVVTPSTQTSGKRRKRTPSNVDVRKRSTRSFSFSTQITEPEPGPVNRISLPSNSHKGSLLGIDAAAPGKATGNRRHSRKGSKGSKADSYAERFSRE